MRQGFDRLLRDKTRPSRIKPLSPVFFLPCLSSSSSDPRTPTHARRCSICQRFMVEALSTPFARSALSHAHAAAKMVELSQSALSGHSRQDLVTQRSR
jgi:hypothetical protein